LSFESELKERQLGGVTVARDGEVAVVTLASGENRFHPDLLDALESALSDLEKADSPLAVVLTGDGKFFSNGLDLEYLAGATAEAQQANLSRVHHLFARVLGFPGFTVAAVNGHAFAAGAMLSLACDERVMREDRGFFCLPEVDLGMPFTPGMQALITSRLDGPTAREAMVTGRRYGGAEALARGIVDAAVAEAEVLPEAVRRAAAMAGKPRDTLATIKRNLSAATLAVLEGR
jgi:enoyl-CoA hydratase/carnithine racemase